MGRNVRGRKDCLFSHVALGDYIIQPLMIRCIWEGMYKLNVDICIHMLR